VPDTVEVSMRQKDNTQFISVDHQNSPVRSSFTSRCTTFDGSALAGNYDLPPHGVLVLDDHPVNRFSDLVDAIIPKLTGF